MICKRCGRYNPDGSKSCQYCGNTPVDGGSMFTPPKTNYYISRKGMGIFLSLILGVIGLVIGLLMYDDTCGERSTFIRGWVIGFIIQIAIILVLVGIISCAACMMLNNPALM